LEKINERGRKKMAPTMKTFKVYYRAGSNSSYTVVKAQNRWDARSKAKIALPPGAKIVSVEQQ
jgi:hypothetical protein